MIMIIVKLRNRNKMKQTTLRKYIVNEDSGAEDEEDEPAVVADKIRKSDTYYWTRVQDRDEMGQQ